MVDSALAVSYKLDGIPDFQALMKKGRAAGGDPRVLLIDSGLYLLRSLDKTFLAQGRPAPWAPLRCRDGQILRDKGILHKSFTVQGAKGNVFKITGKSVEVGSNDFRAAIHHFGATIQAKGPRQVKYKRGGKEFTRTVTGMTFLNQKTGTWITVQKVVIPARPIAVLQPEDPGNLEKIAVAWLNKAMQGGGK